MKNLENQVALITGGSTGIGKAIAIRMASEGAKVIVNYFQHVEKAKEVVEEIQSKGGKAWMQKADISKEEEVLSMFSNIQNQFERLDILVNNAGRQKDREFLSMSLDDWKAVIDVDLTGHFLCAREAANIFAGQKTDDETDSRGVMVFITSVHQNIPWSKRANYTAAKAGASMLMKSIAQELAPLKIRANAIAPGAVKTAINIENFNNPEEKEKIMRKIPYGRPGKVEDIASAACWLVSKEANYITGETLFVDGGMELYADFAHGG